MSERKITRRTVLRGFGTAIALPWLEAMLPGQSWAAPAAGGAPQRMAFLYVPNGCHMPDWTPTAEGRDFELPSILEPLASVRDELNVLTGLTHNNARALGDGGGDHARSVSCFLTGAHPHKTSGADIKVGVSVDQFAAQQIGERTRFPSLELGIDRGAQSGNCDSGYSCAYSSNVSWRDENTPVAKEVDPRLVFDRLFGSPLSREAREAQAKRDLYNKSILDFVQDDARRLQRQLGQKDQQKLDEYLTGVREIEKRIQLNDANGEAPRIKPDIPRPSGIPREFAEHVRLMYDLMALAFQADVTRISTFMYANAGSNRSYKEIGVTSGHHSLSHHGNNQDKQADISKINRFHMEQFAYFLEKLRSIPEGNGSLLDNCMVVYGSAISDGNRHNHDDLPILLAGRGGGVIETGRHVRYEKETPLMNLYLSMLGIAGVDCEKLGDSTGPLLGLEG